MLLIIRRKKTDKFPEEEKELIKIRRSRNCKNKEEEELIKTRRCRNCKNKEVKEIIDKIKM